MRKEKRIKTFAFGVSTGFSCSNSFPSFDSPVDLPFYALRVSQIRCQRRPEG
ncbi:hypothetical protein BDN67DRAFT_970708 [Paxillus ammoniavirescens]|nr:hypothetical protein BDN67DRAFT_970708 [Paxillus ammoniavirescens]